MRARADLCWWASANACCLVLGLGLAAALPLRAQETLRSASAKEGFVQKAAAQKIGALPEGAVKLEQVRPVASATPTAVPAAGTTAPAPDPAPVTAAPPVTARLPRTGTRVPRPSSREQMLEVPLAVEGDAALQADKLRVISAGGARIKAQGQAAPVLELPVNGRAIVSSEQGKKSAERDPIVVDRKTALPWLVIETERRGDTQAVRAARPFLTLAKAITWHARDRLHVAEFLFGLDPEGGVLGALQQPIEARFSVSCDDVAPELARVEKIGPGGYGSVRVRCSPAVKNEQPQQFLTVHVEQGTLRYPFEIPRRPGSLRLSASAISLPGFGFGSLALTGEQFEEDGSPLRAQRATDLQLSADRSSLDVSALRISEGTTSATVDVHPRGVGPVALVLLHGSLRSPPLQLQLTWPWFALAAMIAGGTLGGVLFLFGPRPKSAGSASIWRKYPALRRAVEGALVGLLVTAFVLIVPSFALIPEWARSSELGMFVLAALAGFAGTPLLDLAARALFPALGKERAQGGTKR